MKVLVVQDQCTGCGLCAKTCPELFEINDDNFSFTRMEKVPAEYDNRCRKAADLCPVEEIALMESATIVTLISVFKSSRISVER